MVVDTSAVLALFFAEANSDWVAGQLSEREGELRMSTVNLAETLILLRDRQPNSWEELETSLLGSSICFVPPDVEDAQLAAEARIRYPLNLGDCFAYALAKRYSQSLLTLDADFRATDVEVVSPT